MTREQLQAELEQHAGECLTKLEGFKQVQAEYTQALRALRVFTGPGHKNGEAVQARGPGFAKNTRSVDLANAKKAQAVMGRALRGEGVTVATLIKILAKAGVRANNQTVHNQLRGFDKLGVLVRSDGVGTAKVYKLKG